MTLNGTRGVELELLVILPLLSDLEMSSADNKKLPIDSIATSKQKLH